MKEYIEKDALIKATEGTPFTMSMFLSYCDVCGAKMDGGVNDAID